MDLEIRHDKLRCKNNIKVEKVRFASISSLNMHILHIGILGMKEYQISHISVKFRDFISNMEKVMHFFGFYHHFAMSPQCTPFLESVPPCFARGNIVFWIFRLRLKHADTSLQFAFRASMDDVKSSHENYKMQKMAKTHDGWWAW